MLTLFSQYFVPKNSKRRAEIDLCFQKNIENPLIDQFIIFFESEKDMLLIKDHPRVIKKLQSRRMTYGFWLQETNRLPIGTLSILVNSDIYLNETIQYLLVHRQYMQEHKKFIALSRYNPEGSGLRLNSDPHWTQDTWALTRPVEGIPSELMQEASFELGHPGCDNKIAYVMHSYGYGITNPCDFVQTIHLQADMRRAYDARSNKLLGIHAFVHPTLTIEENSKLDFDLLSRNLQVMGHLRVNNWINETKDYHLKVNLDEVSDLIGRHEIPTKIHKPPLDVIDTKNDEFKISREFEWIKRESFDSSGLFLVNQYSKQYTVYEDEAFYYFYDLYWPSVRRIRREDVYLVDQEGIDLKRLFCAGFVPSIIEVDGLDIGLVKKFDEDTLFWQAPAKTELDALERHYQIASPSFDDNVVDTYIGLPWASFIDQYKFHPDLRDRAIPSYLIGLIATRIRTAKKCLESLGLQLKVHTVCQQIYWQDIGHVFIQAGITDLWLAHKEQGANFYEGIKLHAWPLYAVNIEDSSRQFGLRDIPVEERAYLGSFIGAHMAHYLTDIRLKITQYLSGLPDYFIMLKDMWHFNDLVYNKQINLEVEEFNNKNENENSLVEYNQILSNSKFSLCPLGAGLNSLRLWESMALGSVPVILADGYELPLVLDESGNPIDWTQCVIHFPEKDIERLDSHLKEISTDRLKRMSVAARKAYQHSTAKTCFGEIPSNRRQGNVALKQKMCIYVPYFGEKDKYFWRRSPHGLYDLVMDWHQKGWCTIVHHDGPYYWIGGIGQILLFDRDQVADLIDKKRGKPRWAGEVPYKYGFFCNEYNLENDRNFKFEYWSYKPIELEKRALSITPKSYSERTIESIFLGSIENETQEYFRNKFLDWGDFIDEYHVADKLNNKESNKYNFEEYLERISSSKFGVCFRGNGPKCYREIEYAAWGTPLIITEGVDTNYPDPLIEGIHYFYAKTKEDIKRFASETSEDKWEQMSKSVRNWYEKNFTSKQMFQKLNDKVSGLDLTLKKPKTLFIKPGSEEDYRLTSESLKIFNPNVYIVENEADNISGVFVEAGDIFINEFPYLNNLISYQYLLDTNVTEDSKSIICKSELIKLNSLCILLRWKLENFDLKLSINDKLIDPINYISKDGILDIKESGVKYSIDIRYNYRRLLSKKYLPKKIAGYSPITFPSILIKIALLKFIYNNKLYEEDATLKFSEYVAYNNQLPKKDDIYKIFKLWEIESESIIGLECNYLENGINKNKKYDFTV